MQSNLLLILIAIILATSLAGCDTMKGMGKDIETVGENIQESAN